jgi:dUTP pyrophosphatase
MIVKIKKLHENAVIPFYAKPGDAGLDLTAISESWDKNNTMVT